MKGLVRCIIPLLAIALWTGCASTRRAVSHESVDNYQPRRLAANARTVSHSAGKIASSVVRGSKSVPKSPKRTVSRLMKGSSRVLRRIVKTPMKIASGSAAIKTLVGMHPLP